MTPTSARRLVLTTLYPALFLSGAAALSYQATWGRMLQRVFGVSDQAIATVLASFFLGLGVGSVLGEKLVRRFGGPVRLYALLEIGIGVWAVASLALVPRIHDLYAGLGSDAGFGTLTLLRFLLAFLVLLPPTLAMGATLPVLVAAVARRGVAWSSAATSLYATNTLGAVLGAGLTGLYLVPELGTRATVALAAAASFAAAMLVLVVGLATRGGSEDSAAEDSAVETPPEADPPATPAGTEPHPVHPVHPVHAAHAAQPTLAALLAAVAGFAALAGEVLWTRVLRMVVHGTTQAFAAMLVNFLLGIALGSLLADRLVRRRSPALVFGVVQLALVFLTALTTVLAANSPRFVVLLHGDYFTVPHEPWVIVALAAIVLFPLALALGTSIPLAWHLASGATHHDSGEAARTSGRILAANTLGGLVGSLAAGFVLVPLLGVEWSVLLVLTVHGAAAALALRVAMGGQGYVREAAGLLVPAVAVMALLVARPSLNLPYLLDSWYDPAAALVHGADGRWKEQVELLDEGRNTTVTVVQRDSMLRLFNDGRPESGFGTGEPGFGEELSTLGSLATLFAEPRERAMVVGLGAGHTTAVMLGGPWPRLDVVELEAAVVRASRYLYRERGKPFPLDDARTHLIVDDARAQLVLSPPNRYQAVVSQPSHPWLAGSSALYTREFFQEVDRALAPGGAFALWVNLFRMDEAHLQNVVATLLEVFPHALAFNVESSSFILVASQAPLPLDARFAERVEDAGLEPFLGPFALDSFVDLGAALELDDAGAHAFAAGATEIIVDDRPSLELDLSRMPHGDEMSVADLDMALVEIPWMSEDTLSRVPADLRAPLLVQRVLETAQRPEAAMRLELALPELALPEPERQLVAGVLAAEGGRPGEARAAFAASGLPDAVARLELLLRDDAAWGALRDRWRQGLPREDATPYLLAALGLGDRALAAEVAAWSVPRGGGRLARFAASWAAAAEDPERAGDALVLADDGALDLRAPALAAAAELARRTGDPELGLRLERARLHALRVEAHDATERGLEAYATGLMTRAEQLFTRAVARFPANGQAASNLARLRHDAGDEEGASAILTDCWAAARGLESEEQLLRQAAEELGLEGPFR
ncbi:MAG: MFS transporter [Myxococcota bacterium]